MGAHPAKPPREFQEEPKGKPNRTVLVTWKPFLWSAGFIALSFFYLTQVAPEIVPLDEEVKVPFPAATRFLEGVCTWCGNHPTEVAVVGIALLLPGLFLKFTLSKERYYTRLAIVVALALGFTYISISAPIDRLIHAVDKAIPSDRRVPPAR